MASNYENVDKDVIPIDFNLGDFVWAKWHGITRIISYAIICPAFGSNDQYTKVDESQGLWPIRYYHVQRLGQIFEQDWISEDDLNLVEHDDMKFLSKDECKVFKKTNEEREWKFVGSEPMQIRTLQMLEIMENFLSQKLRMNN